MTGGNNRKIVLKATIICSLLVLFALEQGVLGQCTGGFPINLAVYEGTQNTTMICNSPTKVLWGFFPVTERTNSYVITNYDDVVTSNYTNLYGINPNGLVIKTAQWESTIPPLPTAGLYFILISGSTLSYGAKLTVVRQPPTCSCTAINSTNIQMNCSLTYADHTYSPSNAKMTRTTVDGNFYRNDTPVRMSGHWYVTSTSSIIVDIDDSTNYQCTVTLTEPTSINFHTAQDAMNAPTFSASCIPQFCGITGKTTLPIVTTEPLLITGSIDQSTTEPGSYNRTNANNGITNNCNQDGISDGGKIGIGVGIGVGAMLVIGVVRFAVLCSRYKWIKRTETGNQVVGNKETNKMEDYEEMTTNPDTALQYETIDVSRI